MQHLLDENENENVNVNVNVDVDMDVDATSVNASALEGSLSRDGQAWEKLLPPLDWTPHAALSPFPANGFGEPREGTEPRPDPDPAQHEALQHKDDTTTCQQHFLSSELAVGKASSMSAREMRILSSALRTLDAAHGNAVHGNSIDSGNGNGNAAHGKVGRRRRNRFDEAQKDE